MTRALPAGRYRPLWIGAIALLLLPFAMLAVGLTVDTAAVVVILSIAAMGLNVLVGYTGLTSFGHGAWFGVDAYAGALAQLNWFPGEILLPTLFALAFVAVLSLVFGFLILRRRGVYFALLTLALAALTYSIAFRWTAPIACTIVCDDARLETALPKIVNAAYRKAGQVCTSIQLLLAHASIASDVEAQLATRVQALS